MEKQATVFGKRLREARLRAGLSMRGVGVKMLLPPKRASVYVSRWESGGRTPELGTVNQIARVVSVPPSYLIEPSDTIAEIILLSARLEISKKEKLLEQLREQVGDDILFEKGKPKD